MTVTNKAVEIDGNLRVDHDRFHDTFSELFGFPDFYGRNVDAWNDCMSSLDDPESRMTTFHAEKGKAVTLKINSYEYLRKAGKDQWLDLLECSAFVNFRRVETGINPLIALAFFK